MSWIEWHQRGLNSVSLGRSGAVGALYGPLHGGANEAVLRMLERIGSIDRIDAFLAGVKAKKEKMFGFGHRHAAHPRSFSMAD